MTYPHLLITQFLCDDFILATLLEELASYYQLTDPDLSGQLLSSPSFPCSGSSHPDYPVRTPSATQKSTGAATPVATISYKPAGPSFGFCGTFSGKGQSAHRWLMSFEHEMAGYKQNNTIPADLYLNSLNMLLIDDAEDWAESHPDAIELLKEDTSTQQTVDNFKSLLYERFPPKEVELTPVPFDEKLSELQQKSDGPLSSYYKRAANKMHRVGAKNRTSTGSRLSYTESALLDSVLKGFIIGIADLAVRKEAARELAHDRSLRSVYTKAEEVRRINIEVQKLLDEELKADELAFYKTLAERNLSTHKIDALLTSYHIAKAATQSNRISPFQWSPDSVQFDERPPQADRPRATMEPYQKSDSR